MKIVLSRKGFDSSAGGVASPITPSNELLSLPIPDRFSRTRYRDLRGCRPSVAKWANSLSNGRVKPGDGVHLDPDLNRSSLPRLPAWTPAFGQAGAALGHLDAMGVGVGDLFLFFGWYRRVERHQSCWRYVPNAPDLHVLYGWMAVGSIWRPPSPVPTALQQHIHTQREFKGNNAIYASASDWCAGEKTVPGSGLWRSCCEELVLTGGDSRSQWVLPSWFYPEGRASTLSYHQRLDRWQMDNGLCRLQLAARGQEFVLDTEHYPEALDWAAGLIQLAEG
ncbi:MAG: hypothetical protein ACPGSC_08745 [Granulosicoccaceae bacterium]